MRSATLTSKGQITLPKAIRKHLRVEPGHRVEFLITEDGRVEVSASAVDITRLKSLLPRPKRRLSLEEIDEAIRRRGASR